MIRVAHVLGILPGDLGSVREQLSVCVKSADIKETV